MFTSAAKPQSACVAEWCHIFIDSIIIYFINFTSYCIVALGEAFETLLLPPEMQYYVTG